MVGIKSSTDEHKQEHTPLARDLLQAGRYYLHDRRVWVAVAIVAVLGGVALNWGWLVAAGLAPLVLLLLPCALMCALPFCMKSSGDGSREKGAAPGQPNQLPPSAGSASDKDR